MRRSVPLATLVILAVVAGIGAGCGSDDKPAPTVVALAGQTVATEKLLTIGAGICDAAHKAGSDIDGARQTFFAQSHDGLHLIARGLQDIDRAASAALLEAKQKVEADFLAPPPGGQAVADLNRLATVTRSSLARFKVSADACPPT
jgi:hypothetical protein